MLTVPNNAPVFVFPTGQTSYTFNLAENTDGSTTAVPVGTVEATDDDTEHTVSYSIEAGNTGGVFAIGSDGAITYTGSGEDHETTQSFSLTVRATDGVANTDVTVTVTVTDVNEPPAFTAATTGFSVEENTTAVGSAAAADPDSADTTVAYALGGTDASLFQIGSGGAISFRAAPDFESPQGGAADNSNEYTFTVTASAGGTGRTMSTPERTITVTVTDANEPPGKPGAPAVSPTANSSASLDVSWSAPTNTGPAITGYNVQYRLASTAPSGAWTDHAHTGAGAATAIGSLAAETSYQVQVRATNPEGTGEWSDSGTGTTRASRSDLIVKKVTTTRPSPGRGQAFFVGATVHNSGTETTGATTLRFYFSTDSTIDTNDRVLATSNVAALDANAETEIPAIKITASTVLGTYYYGACVDTFTGESDPDNNCASRTIEVVNLPPTFNEGGSATRSFAENTAAGQDVGAPFFPIDEDSPGEMTVTLEGRTRVPSPWS